MKNLILLSGIMLLVLTSCEKTIQPVANFSSDAEYVQPGEVINFYNHSSGYSILEWDFGDGTFSTVREPNHWYATPGIYTVTLKASSSEGVDYATMHIDVDYLEPISDFVSEYDYYEPSEIVQFFNSSSKAEEYLWEFGDGASSTLIEPTHVYNKEGIYTVKLSAYNGTKVNVSYYEVSVQYTKLEVEVVEWATDDKIENAEVTLYTSFADWENFRYPIITGFTDYNGSVIFEKMNTISYYIDVVRNDANNESLGYEDVDFIKTLPLEHGRHNVFIAYVDYVTPKAKVAGSSSADNRVRKQVIKSVKRSVKESKKPLQRVK
jgi:PKD repeat protein